MASPGKPACSKSCPAVKGASIRLVKQAQGTLYRRYRVDNTFRALHCDKSHLGGLQASYTVLVMPLSAPMVANKPVACHAHQPVDEHGARQLFTMARWSDDVADACRPLEHCSESLLIGLQAQCDALVVPLSALKTADSASGMPSTPAAQILLGAYRGQAVRGC